MCHITVQLGKETMAPSINTEILENIDAYSLRVFTIAAFLRLLIDSEGKNKSKFAQHVRLNKATGIVTPSTTWNNMKDNIVRN
jgi:hypothetical protein